jgi:hypothetical protein
MIEAPQRVESAPAFLRDLNDRVNTLSDAVRAMRISNSPTVQADETAIGTTLKVVAVEETTSTTPKMTWTP